MKNESTIVHGSSSAPKKARKIDTALLNVPTN